MKIHLTEDQWGGARQGKDGKFKTYRKPRTVSQQQKWRGSKKQTVISRKAAAKLSRP